MKSATGHIAPLVQAFFTDHLVRQRRASPQTVASYRDTFRLLLQHLSQTTGRKPSDLTLDDMPAKAIVRFLDTIERDRGNSVQTRNARLAAIRSFFRLVTLREPARIDLAAQVLAIPVKRADRRLIGYLTRPEVDAIVATPNTQTWIGRRDYALLSTLYNTGARISEILALRQHDLAFGATSLLHLKGKGRKERSVPLWPTTSRTLRAWIADCGDSGDRILFPSARGGPLSTDGATYILQQAVRRALPTCPSLKAKRISPHVIRHTTAMHLLQSGVEIAVIALWLGHESLDTTHMYIQADLKTKELALGKLQAVAGGFPRFKPDDALLAFLSAL
jgi:site-specific recombinase XerD